jgi:hypothetical protein
MEFILDEKMKRRILIGILVIILLIVFSLIFMDFSHTCKGTIFYAMCMFFFIVISFYIIKDKPRIERIFPYFILLFMLLQSLWMVYDNCYCDVHISNYNYVYILKKIMMIIFFSFGIFIIQMM